MKRYFLLMWLLIMLPAAATAFGYLDARGSGTAVAGYSARGVSLGGVRSIGLGDGSCTLTNPAGLVRLPGALLSVSIGPGIGNETVLDSLGQQDNNWISLSTLFAAATMGLGQDLTAGISLGRTTDFSYEGINYIYQFGQSAQLEEIREMKVTGGFFESAAGLAYRPAPWLSLGASGGLRFGSVSYDSSFTDNDQPQNDTTVTWEREADGFTLHAGAEILLNSSVIGLSWASGDDNIDARGAAGALLYLDENRRGAMGAEVELMDPGDRNGTVFRIFGIVSPYESLDFRGCLNFSMPNYENLDTGTIMGFALGTGVYLNRVTLDGGLSWTSSSRDSIFIGTGVPDDISDSNVLISLGMTLDI